MTIEQMAMATKIGSFLAKLGSKQAVELTKQVTDSTKAVFDLAKTIKEKPLDGELLKTVQPYVGQMSSLLDVLNSPLGLMVKEVLPFASIAVTLLNLVCEATKKEPTLEECMALVVQSAYLDSVREFLTEIDLSKIQASQASDAVRRQIQKLGEFELQDDDARTAILFFHESEIAKAFSAVLEARLTEVGCSDVRRSAELVARNTNHHIQTALAGMGEKVNPVVKWFSTGGQEKFEQYLSIEEYLRDVISPDSTIQVLRDRWRVFNEPFTLKEIYVPIEAQFIDKNGEVEDRDWVVLEEWAKAWLNQPNQNKVLFIQGHPGRGKSVFCRMFAEWVRVNEHPNWTPILIRLRDVQNLEKDFEETLRKAVNKDFASSDNGWLSDRNTRFLFLLDGFDELLMQGRTSSGLEEFLEQIERFQRRCQENSEKGHLVLVTGRTLSLQSIESRMPSNLERLEIVEMSSKLREQWFAKWAQLVGSQRTNAFKQFLQSEQCPERVRELAREPLLLFLLAAMHRDEKLKLSSFKGAEGIQAKILIYEKTIDWVLTEQRPDMLNRDLTELEVEDLRSILTEAGLASVQAGGESAPISMIEARLKSNANVQKLLEEARHRLNDNPLRNALAAFYVKPGKGGSVEFVHKSFGEFLCAERLKDAIESWIEPGRKRDRFYVPTEQLHREIYDLLGSPVLSKEIVEYLMELLKRSNWFKPLELFERLNEFYELWCEGEFIDASPENLPQEKMRSLREQQPDQKRTLGLRQVDVYTGYNVLILLLELHQYAQDRKEFKEKIVFHPSGQLAEGEEHTSRLLQIISYGDCIELGGFRVIVGDFLAFANLSNANLSNANLSNANFYRANLSNANLSNANLSNANFYRANLSGADLSSTDFFRTDFLRADLFRANLFCANLFYADLCSADLYCANLASANLSKINWNEETNWEEVHGLDTAQNIPIALKQQLGLE
ncbi:MULTISPECIES: pentapeptide repeat-containing protein [Leptolyngbya]|uniref:pentapeptide repeat-containing protein n=1 Tax=Leptolyngbya TaxID=47251 RepID=UPI001685B6FB|nr:pentapeptide repeat-containing protein [Leptolyngbya sp. FACHB-1624]MBD1855609.1 pentapeptide repeat-containing protein [Leptolyngbya sp. FACHB-1624]